MPEQVKLWRVTAGDYLEEVPVAPLDLEDRLESWMAGDISMLQSGLLVIGRQVQTDYGGIIDLLCLDQDGDCVIVELKRGLTPREVAAQALDYASWVNDLSGKRIEDIANAYLGAAGPLEEAFSRRFNSELPEVLNGDHSILVVGSQIDASTERIIRYLSGVHGVAINAATFQYFQTESGEELLSRLVLLEQAPAMRSSGSKRRPNLTFDELREIAKENGVGGLYDALMDELSKSPRLIKQPTLSSVSFAALLDGSRRTIFSLIPTKSSAEAGLHFQLYVARALNLTGLAEVDLMAFVPIDRQPWSYPGSVDPGWAGVSGYFHDHDECERFIRGFTAA